MFNFQLLSYFLFFCLIQLVSCENEICNYKEIPYPGLRYLRRGDPYHNSSSTTAIISYWDEFNGGFTYCNGVMLNRTFVITRASCLIHTKCKRDRFSKQFQCLIAQASDYQAIMGTTYVISNEKSYIRDGKTIYINPNFTKSKNYSYDIGMLELTTPFPIIEKLIDKNYHIFQLSHHYYNFFKKTPNKFAVMYYGKSSCSSFFSLDIRKNKYTFIRTPEKNYARLQEVKVDSNIDEEECKRLFETYKNLGMELCPYNIFCIKTLYPVPNCDDLSGAAVTYADQKVIIGIMLSRPVCAMNKYFFVLRFSAFTQFLYGTPRRLNKDQPAWENTWC